MLLEDGTNLALSQQRSAKSVVFSCSLVGRVENQEKGPGGQKRRRFGALHGRQGLFPHLVALIASHSGLDGDASQLRCLPGQLKVLEPIPRDLGRHLFGHQEAPDWVGPNLLRAVAVSSSWPAHQAKPLDVLLLRCRTMVELRRAMQQNAIAKKPLRQQAHASTEVSQPSPSTVAIHNMAVALNVGRHGFQTYLSQCWTHLGEVHLVALLCSAQPLHLGPQGPTLCNLELYACPNTLKMV